MTEQVNVLVPLDGSPLAEQAIPFAQAVAGEGAGLTFLQVVPKPEPLRGIMGAVLATEDDVMLMESETARALLSETAERWGSHLKAPVAVEVAAGDPATAILDAAETLKSEIIVIASHGRGALGRLAFGSVADRIARGSRTPVLIVHPDEGGPENQPMRTLQRLIVPIDGSDNALQALPLAITIAQRQNLPIHLIEVINPATLLLPSPIGVSNYPAEFYQEIEDEMATSAKESLEAASAMVAAADVPVTSAILEGATVDSIESELQPGDLIVMTSHGRGGIRRWLLGSVAEKLIRLGKSPVVLVPVSDRQDMVEAS